ncbi:M15 family metallopeptidase [Fimbriimonas ginsengisoli]|uniref:D-ala-D-ala dipeptidase n=1 Tax=Fimbriimonas ginsengisoli Gsoil 348 TaxID=661478 RepID=A0A068NUU7_FIMGI|nr:M15 family metallopeptidase [Fimbriimonas ginsengisoli]AIE86530.1 D-ala-D-ala dipeptidase [Fimbriimonas ginsengisoli Gsoil 348]
MNKWDRTKGRPEPIRLLNAIKERENGEPLVDVREAAPSLRILRPQVIPYVRKTVAEMVEQAARALPEGYHLGLVEGWRPIERQQRIYDSMWKFAQEAFPHRDHAALRRTVCRWVAPTDQKAPPGHCTGAAVDVWLVDDAGELIDVSSPFDRFKAAPTYSLGLSETAARNRTILVDAMLDAGFSNCRDEWWHYSWGDAGWAVRMDRLECVYGLARLAPDLYEELERLHEEGMKERQNPFLPPV